MDDAMEARQRLNRKGLRRWTSTAAAAVMLLMACSDYGLQPVQAHSVHLEAHSRLHVPRDVSYTALRRHDHPRASRNHGRSSTSNKVAGVDGTLLRRGLGGVFPDALPSSSRKRRSRQLPQQMHLVSHQAIYSGQDTLEWDDSLLLRLAVPDSDDDDEYISMLLHPVEDFVHPDAKIVYTDTDPWTGAESIYEEPLLRETLRIYRGVVLHEHQIEARVQEARIGWNDAVQHPGNHRGWARIVVSPDYNPSQDISRFLAEGAFEVDGEMHHLKTLDSYERSRRHDEPEVQRRSIGDAGRTGMIMLRDRDLPSLSKRTASPPPKCAHDNLAFNTDPSHPTWSTARQLAFDAEYARKPSWIDNMLGLDAENDFTSSFSSAVAARYSGSEHLIRRQSGGDISGGGSNTGNYISTIGQTTSCPKSARVLYMGVAADCTYVAHYGGNVSRASTQILSNMNTVSEIYARTFNVSLGIVELQVPTGGCPRTQNSSLPWNVGCQEGGSPGVDLNTRLSLFSQWRGQKGGADGAGLWHLMTNCSTGQEVGVAWLGTLCRVTASTSDGESTSGTAVTAITSREWQVMAHEIGHNFGAIHDCSSGCSLSGQCCPLSQSTCNANDGFIMSPVSVRSTDSFSQCSIGNICTAIGQSLNTTCLFTPGNRKVISLQQCGNGIVEPGEECDPGGRTSQCCDSSTCKLRSGAQCDPTNSECCTGQCRFAGNSTVCRPAVSQACDIAETCQGTSGTCPPDVTQPNGKSCGSGSLACANGYCTSKDQQCQTLGGSLGITGACPNAGDTSCTVTCAAPNSGGGSCIILDGQNFVDGTPCGYGGTCKSGSCQSGDWQDTVKSWYTNNLRISIPVTVVGGIIILLLLYAISRCIWRCCTREHKRNQAVSSKYYNAPAAPPPNMASQPPVMSHNAMAHMSSDSTQPFAHQGAWQQPQQPYPAYQPPGNPYYR